MLIVLRNCKSSLGKEKANDVKEGIKRGVDETKVKAHLAKEDIKEGAEKIKEKVKNEISKKK